MTVGMDCRGRQGRPRNDSGDNGARDAKALFVIARVAWQHVAIHANKP